MVITYITEPQIKIIKSDLLHLCRKEKLVTSSHLTEALAFAFGFNTNAALIKEFEVFQGPLCVEFCVDNFWKRLSELAKISLPTLQGALYIDLPTSVSRAIERRDLRERVNLPPDFAAHLSKFFKLMADHGAAHFLVEATRISPAILGFSGSYRSKGGQMRACFNVGKPSDYWQWDDTSWSALLADDFLSDHAGLDCDLMGWARVAHSLLEPELRLGNVVFNAELGLLVSHEIVDGCTESILYQRPGQIKEIRDADELQSRTQRVSAFV